MLGWNMLQPVVLASSEDVVEKQFTMRELCIAASAGASLGMECALQAPGLSTIEWSYS